MLSLICQHNLFSLISIISVIAEVRQNEFASTTVKENQVPMRQYTDSVERRFQGNRAVQRESTLTLKVIKITPTRITQIQTIRVFD